MLADLKPQAPDDETAEETAIEILTWLAGEKALMRRFLDLSGIEADDIRASVGRRSFYVGLFIFLLDHEPTLIQFSYRKNIPAEWVRRCYEHFADESAPWG